MLWGRQKRDGVGDLREEFCWILKDVKKLRE